MAANKIDIAEQVSASRKLGAEDARKILKEASQLTVMKGKKVSDQKIPARVTKDLVDTMLGPTGNLRAPTIRRGKRVLVGFNQDVFADVFG